ncbi:MAG: HAMP domain-containing protein [Spirochaetales bacterium]|nr:HAMP domain-containing protein [Spirochaetales bacterium]
MNRLFARTLMTVLGALLILVAVMAAASAVGFRRSLDGWAQIRTLQLEEAARQIILRFPDPAELPVPEDVPLFVYDSAGQLIWSNRGEGGRRRGGSASAPQGVQDELIELREGGRLLGYYRSAQMRFENDAANNRFLNSLRLTTWLGLALALIISVPLAAVFSRSLSRPAIALCRGLDRISRGDLSVRVPERGAEELTRIARSTNRLAEQLEREQGIRRQWVQDIAHDLRTPIAAMRAQFEGMRDGVLDLSGERIGKSLRELSRLESLVADLEELMRLESPEMKVSMEEIEADAFIEEIAGRFAAELAGRGIRISESCGTDRFRADPGLLQRAVGNFIVNAIRHTPRGGLIECSITPAGDGKVSISVANSGEPIPAAELEKVFDRLFRGEYARSSPGSGLGLTIARRIAELHGGRAAVRNREGGGVIAELVV